MRDDPVEDALAKSQHAATLASTLAGRLLSAVLVPNARDFVLGSIASDLNAAKEAAEEMIAAIAVLQKEL